MTGNVYVLLDPKTKQFCFVDSGFTDPFAKIIVDEITSAGLRIEDLQSIYHTHSHTDHWGNDHYLRKLAPDAKIGFHESAEEYIRDPLGWLNKFEILTSKDPEYVASFSEDIRKTAKPLRMDLYLTEGSELKIGPHNFRIMHVPGHERDNLSFYDSRSKILISGSYLRAEDSTWTYSVQGGGVSAVRKTLDRLEGLDYNIALPNHGRPLLTRSQIKEAFKRARNDIERRNQVIKDLLEADPKDFATILQKFPAVQKLHSWYMERILYAHLIELEEAAIIERTGDMWQLCS
jgi:hydroxyacylglutathione hydrolase